MSADGRSTGAKRAAIGRPSVVVEAPRLASISCKPRRPKQEEDGAAEEDQCLVIQVVGEPVGGEE